MKLRLTRKWLIVTFLITGLAPLIAFGELLLPGEMPDCKGHRLVGTWSEDIRVCADTFRDDGTGLTGNGLGNFPFHWRILRQRGDSVTVRIEYTGYSWGSDPSKIYGPAESFVVQPDHDLKLVFQSNDAIQTNGVVLNRQK